MAASAVVAPALNAPRSRRDLTDPWLAHRLDLSRDPLPPVERPGALGVLDVTKWFGEASGGVKTYLLEKARWVSQQPDVRHALIIPGSFDAVAVGAGTHLYRLKGPRIPRQSAYRFLLAPRTLRRILQHEHPDIVEVGSPIFVPWLTARAARGLRVPMVQFYHTSIASAWRSLGLAEAPGRLGQRMLGGWMRAIDRLVSRTLVASDFAARELASVGITRVSRVPLGVDLAHFHPGRRAGRERLLRRLGLPIDRPLALYLGRFAPEKRIEAVVDAWPLVERATGAHLALVGAGPLESALRERATSMRVSLLPYQHDRETLAGLLAAADVYVAPGDAETFGLSALEALASGVPVASSQRGAVAELVSASGAGTLFEAGQAADCARAVLAVLGDDFTVLSARARRYAEAAHDWAHVFAQQVQVYRDIIAEHRA